MERSSTRLSLRTSGLAPGPSARPALELLLLQLTQQPAGAAVGQSYGSVPVWLHPDYIPLAEACWSRQPKDRPTMPQVIDSWLHGHKTADSKSNSYQLRVTLHHKQKHHYS